MFVENKNKMCCLHRIKIAAVSTLFVFLLVLSGNHVFSYPSHSPQMKLAGPWEIAVKPGQTGQGGVFPVAVDDESKPQKLDRLLPVIGSPIKIRLDEYQPDLVWETSIVAAQQGGFVIELLFLGEGLNQKMYLVPDDPERKSISSSIGGVVIKELYNAKTAKETVHKFLSSDTIGIVTVRFNDSEGKAVAADYAVGKGVTINLPKSSATLKISDYLPHYSIDKTTKKIVNISDEPVNPAIKIKFNDGKDDYEKWLWSGRSSPHEKVKLPIDVKFTAFDFRKGQGKYAIFVAKGHNPWMFFVKDGKRYIEEVKLEHPYQLTNEMYTYSVQKVTESAVVEKKWKNNSESLSHPAFIVTVQEGQKTEQMVLEFNKPVHYASESEVLLLHYRPQALEK